MKKTLLIIALAFASVMSASAQEPQTLEKKLWPHAQEKGFQFLIGYHGTTCSPFNFNPEFSTMSLEFAPGYAFNRVLSVRLPIAGVYELYQNGSSRTFEHNIMMIGAAVAYQPFVFPYIGGGLEFVAGFGGTVTGESSKYLYYDLGVDFHFGGGLSDINFGIGFRYYQSMAPAFKNRPTMYTSIGYRFN